MSRIESLLRPDHHPSVRKAALPAGAPISAGFVASVLAAVLAGCAQAPAAPATAGGAVAPSVAAAPARKPIIDFASCSKPAWPQEALARKATGTSTVRFLIDTDGSVVESSVLRSSGDAALDEAARAAIAKCRFTPAVPAGGSQPVRAWVPVQYVWTH